MNTRFNPSSFKQQAGGAAPSLDPNVTFGSSASAQSNVGLGGGQGGLFSGANIGQMQMGASIGSAIGQIGGTIIGGVAQKRATDRAIESQERIAKIETEEFQKNLALTRQTRREAARIEEESLRLREMETSYVQRHNMFLRQITERINKRQQQSEQAAKLKQKLVDNENFSNTLASIYSNRGAR